MRFAQCSYGFLRTEPFNDYEEHEGVIPTKDEFDGELYVKNTIDWLVKKGVEVKYHKEHILDAYHLFSTRTKVFKCVEVLYVSDTSTKSHYQVKHEKNKGRTPEPSIRVTGS